MLLELRSQLGITEDQLMILSLSRVAYEKNIQVIVQQFPKVLESFPNARLVIVGKGPHREALEELVAELELQPFVQFTGEVPHNQVALYYRAADYFVSASTSETQGLTYAEALASGTQCIVEGNDYLEALLDDERLGVTFAKDEEFSDTLINYIHKGLVLDDALRERKLIEISAEKFGNEIFVFYQEMVEYYQEHHQKTPLSQKRPVEKVRVKIASLKNSGDK